MWTMLTLGTLAATALVAILRVRLAGRPVPDPNDPSRQDEVPGADAPAPPPTSPTTGLRSRAVDQKRSAPEAESPEARARRSTS